MSRTHLAEAIEDLVADIDQHVAASSIRSVADRAGVNRHSLDKFLLSKGRRCNVVTALKLAEFVESNV